MEENIMLRLNGAGTGFITINAADNTPPLRGKPVELSIGYNDQPVKWFSGYVESDSCTGRGLHKLMVREAAAILQYPLNISMQHPTLKQVAGHIEGNTGLRIQLPKGRLHHHSGPSSDPQWQRLSADGHAWPHIQYPGLRLVSVG
ncbi:putative phage protein [Shigella flexneri 1485-80]|nr:putative phage protein [Shigella flexneri 1485-80]